MTWTHNVNDSKQPSTTSLVCDDIKPWWLYANIDSMPTFTTFTTFYSTSIYLFIVIELTILQIKYHSTTPTSTLVLQENHLDAILTTFTHICQVVPLPLQLMHPMLTTMKSHSLDDRDARLNEGVLSWFRLWCPISRFDAYTSASWINTQHPTTHDPSSDLCLLSYSSLIYCY